MKQLIKPHSSNSSHIVLRVRGHEATQDPEVVRLGQDHLSPVYGHPLARRAGAEERAGGWAA